MKDKILDAWDWACDFAVDKPVKAAASAGAVLSLVAGGIAAPFLMSDDEHHDDAQGVYVQKNPESSDDVDIPTVEQKTPEVTGSNKIHSPEGEQGSASTDSNKSEGGEQTRRAAPKAPPIRLKPDNVSKEEIEKVKERRIPPPDSRRVDQSPHAAQHQLPRPVPGQQVAPPPAPKNKPPVIANTIEIKGQRYPVMAMGVAKDENGHATFAPPENVGEVGWYQDSAEPGTDQQGSVLMAAHVNSATQGSGVGAVFTTLKPGDVISIWNSQGKLTKWKVSKSYENKKDKWQLPASVNRMDGKQSLVLVTCGGAFVGPPLYYQMNIITEADQI